MSALPDYALPDYALPLVGRWQLVRWTGTNEAGESVDHGGERPAGLLIYLPSGQMAVQIQRDGRETFGSSEFDAGTEPLQAAAYRAYIAYAGRFTVPEPGTVVHHLEQALHPDQVGMEKRRQYVLDGDELTLRTQPVLFEGAPASSVLTWRRGR